MNEFGEAIDGLRKISRAHLGRTINDDEAISAVCEEAIEAIERLHAALSESLQYAARIAEAVHPSAASAVGEAHMRSYRDAIAHAIRTAPSPCSPAPPPPAAPA